MRFELFLTELPKASATKVESALAELPKGASTQTVIKAMETRKVPTVSVAWSDDKRVLNEVMDTLLELGAGCRLVDHGSIVQKLATWSAEKLGRARYLDDEANGPRPYFKLGPARENETWQEALVRHALTYFLQLCLAAVLFLWFVALRVGFARAFSVPGLMAQLAGCAAGLLVVYVISESIRGVQSGRLTLKRIAPQLLAGGVLTLASLLFLGDGFEQQATLDGSVKRPPSLPFAGLLTELRRRKLAAELNGNASGGAFEVTGADESEQAEQELWCDGAAEPAPDALQCRAGRAWEDALACFAEPEPTPAARPAVLEPPRRRAPPQERTAAEHVFAAPRSAGAADGGGNMKLELSTLLALIAMLPLSLWLLVLLRRERRAGPRAEDAAQASPEAPPAAAHEAQLAALHAEQDALRAQLVAANEALASAQLDAGAARKPDDAPLANLQRELELTRSTLGANQAAFAQLKQQHAQLTGAQTSLSAELERLKQELAHALRERDLARSALLDLGGRAREPAGSESRTGEPDKAAGRAPTNTNAEDDSSYSVKQVQEERVVLQRRRR